MKRIVFFIGNLSNSGGTERVLSEIGNGLCARGYDISIVSLTGEGPSFFKLDDRITVHWLKSKTLQSDILGNLRKLNKLYRQIRPDVWVDVDIILAVYTLLMKAVNPGMKLISWEHFNFYSQFPVNHQLRQVVHKLVARFSDCILVLSKEDMGYYRENLNIRGLLRQIYNPTPFEHQPPKEKETKTVLAVGRLVQLKGYDMLLQSWSMLEGKHPDWQLVIVGDGEEKAALTQIVADKHLERVTFAGHVENVQEYYQNASVYALTSRCEGFAMVLLEAMAFANPVVAYTVKAGVAEMVIPNVCGFQVEPFDTEDYARKLELLMTQDELRRRMGEAAQKHTEQFSHERILDCWENLLNEMEGI